MEDNLICCIKENPEPVVFRLCCQGVQVELGVSPKQVHFNKLLLHRSVIPQPLCWGRELSVNSPSASLAGCVATQIAGWANISFTKQFPASCSPFFPVLAAPWQPQAL